MTDFRKKILLIGYIFLAALFFFYHLFPEDTVRMYLANRINQNLSNVQIDIGKLDLSFPFSLSLRKVSISNGGSELMAVEYLKLRPRVFSLLSSTKRFAFKGKSYAGTVSGDMDLQLGRNSMDITASCIVSGMEMAQVPAILAQERLGFKGTLSGDFQLNATTSGLENGYGNFSLSNVSLTLTLPIPGFDQLNFDQIDSNFTLDRNSLEIQNLNLEGPDVTGGITGSIFLDYPMPRSELDLEITAALLQSSINSEINIKVTGTFASPKYALAEK
jgi:type II secretion system protein N